jgi:integrase
LRPMEVHRLRWEDIDLSGGYIHVSALKSKTRQRRLVQISGNLSKWLNLKGNLPCKNFVKRFNAVRLAAGINKWPHDALRHSFASYHLAMHGSADRTATEMGHRGTDMLFRHYRELVSNKDAKDFWAIVPKKSCE